MSLTKQGTSSEAQFYQQRDSILTVSLPKCKAKETIFFSISLTIGTSRHMEAQMDLPRLLFGVGFRIFTVTPRMIKLKEEFNYCYIRSFFVCISVLVVLFVIGKGIQDEVFVIIITASLSLQCCHYHYHHHH